MSAIINRDPYLARNRAAARAAVRDPTVERKKPFEMSYKPDGCKIYSSSYQNLDDLQKVSKRFNGEQILPSINSSSIYVGSSYITGQQALGFCNVYSDIGQTVTGNIEKAVDCCLGPYRKGFVLKKDVAENLVVSFEMGVTAILDCNLCPIKKVKVTEFGRSNDMTLNCTGSKIAFANHDKSLSIVNVNSFDLEKRIHSCSGFPLTGVSCDPKNENVFITCSEGLITENNYLTLWDIRECQPGTILTCISQPASAIKWSVQDENIIIFGTQTGAITFMDIRNPKMLSDFGLTAAITKFTSLRNGNQIIGITDSNTFLKVKEKENSFEVIDSKLPSDFMIRDIVEYESKVYVVGSKFPKLFPLEFTL